MRIGIVPALSRFGGGVYQYSLTVLNALEELKSDGIADEFGVFVRDARQPGVLALRQQGWPVMVMPWQRSRLKGLAWGFVNETVGEERFLKSRERVRGWLRPGGHGVDLDAVRPRPALGEWLRQSGAELMIYPVPDILSFESGVPYIMAIHDLQHRLQPEFPEVSADGEWERREYLFRNGSRYATLLLADSEVGKEYILESYESYGVTPDQVKVLPYLPASYLAVSVSDEERRRVRARYHLPERYLFYPAQFWPHKNHKRIVQALGLLAEADHLECPIVFCGSCGGDIMSKTFGEVMSAVHELGLDETVRCLGYVGDDDMSGLYAEAVALVMPTFFGPTNIPVLEAWAFGCPVLTSDIRGIREQMEDAAVLADPRSVESIADGIRRLWTDESLRGQLADLGRQRLTAYTADDFRDRLLYILTEAKERLYAH